jgi:hypothetical protein
MNNVIQYSVLNISSKIQEPKTTNFYEGLTINALKQTISEIFNENVREKKLKICLPNFRSFEKYAVKKGKVKLEAIKEFKNDRNLSTQFLYCRFIPKEQQ